MFFFYIKGLVVLLQALLLYIMEVCNCNFENQIVLSLGVNLEQKEGIRGYNCG
jgi:hypothetical protein